MYYKDFPQFQPQAIKRITDSSTEPVSLAEAKAHLRVDHTNDDSYISTLITASRQSLEISTRRSLGTGQTYQVSYHSFPTVYNRLVIPNPPIVSVTSLQYYDVNNSLITVDSTKYHVENQSEGVGYISLDDGFSRPTISKERIAPVVLTYNTGYANLPKPLHQSILLLVAHYYDTREPVAMGVAPMKVQRSVDFIVDQYKIRKF